MDLESIRNPHKSSYEVSYWKTKSQRFKDSRSFTITIPTDYALTGP